MDLVDSSRLHRGSQYCRAQAYYAAYSTPADRGGGLYRNRAHRDQLDASKNRVILA